MEVLSGMAREPLCGFRERETERRGRRNGDPEWRGKRERGREQKETGKGGRGGAKKMGQVGRI